MKFKETNQICTPLEKLANQLMLNKVHLIEITKAFAVAFMKARNPLVVVVRCRERKKQNMVKMYFLKLLLIDFA